MHAAGWIREATAIGLAFSVTSIQVAAAGELADAAMRGDANAVASLLEGGADVNEPQSDGAAALHWAVYADRPDLAALLIDAGADVAARNRAGVTPLSLAAETGSAAMAERLLDAGADPRETLSNGETALMMAARTGDVKTIELLIDRGAEIDARETKRGTTALMWAAAYGSHGAVQALVDHGADLGLRSDPIQQARRPYLAPTPKERIDEYLRGTGQAGTAIAVDLGGGDDTAEAPVRSVGGEADQPVVATVGEEVLAADRDPVQDAAGESARTAEVVGDPTQPADVVGDFGGYRRERPITGGLTALVFAARHGDIGTVRVLLDAGADVNQATEYGWTALLTATQNRYYQLGRYLLERGADPAIGNTGGWTPLYIATDNRNIENGDYPTRQPDMDHMDYIELLLDHGADPNARMLSSTETRTIFTHQWLREEGATPFWRASQSSDTELMRRLLDAGADPLIATHNGTTALMVASGIGWVEGVTHEWSREQNVQTVNTLLELGANVNARDLDGRTALMGAAHKGRSEIVQMLVEHGADMAARDVGSRDSIHNLFGKTWQAIDYADGLVRVGVQSSIAHPETADLLRRLMTEAGLAVPPAGRTLESICVTELCR